MEAPLSGFRFASVEDEPRIDDAGGRPLGRAVRLSPAGVAFVPEGAPPPRVGDRLGLVLPGIAPLGGRVVDVRQLGGERVAVVELLGVGLDAARAIAALVRRLMASRAGLRDCDFVVEREVITAPARVRELVRALFANRAAGRIRRVDKHDGKGIRLQAARLQPESATPLQWEAEEPWFAPPFWVELDGYVSRFRFRVDEARNVDGFLAAPLPSQLERVRSRHQRRMAAPDGIKIVLRHPRFPELRIERPLRNLSRDGLSFATSVVKDLLWPGLELEDACVVFADRLAVRVRGQVRHVSEDIDAACELCGLHIEPLDEDDATHWHAQLERLLHPDTSIEGTWARPLWELYRDSGYFNLSQKEELDFVPLREPFRDAGRTLAATPSLGCRIVWPSARGLEASLSLVRAYQHGVLVYQLARRPGRAPLRYPGRKILRDLYAHGLEHVSADPSLRWLIVWLQDEARFSRLVHYDLPARYAASGRAELLRFRALELRCDITPHLPSTLGLEFAPATGAELELLLGAVGRRHSRAYAEAHDLTAERLDLGEIGRAWGDAGLERERHVLVARRAGQPIAAAVLELAEAGVHLFALLDLVRLYRLRDGGEAAFAPLLEAARQWYAERGRPRFVYFQLPDDAAHTSGVRMIDLGGAEVTLLPVELWPEQLEHVWEVTSPRDVPPWPTR